MQPLISVIIPYFNTEKYLERCVNSIAIQTYRDLEIVLVDDGSSDKSASIAEKLALEDSRIRNIHISNSGVSAARNTGLENAAGEYVMFVDSDDWMDPGIINDMASLMEKTGADLVTCDISHSVDWPSEQLSNENPASRIYTREEYLRLFFKIDSNEWVHYPVAKLYKKNMLPQPLYPENIRVGEDVLGTYLAISNTKKIAKVEKTGYYYFNNPESATSSFTEKDFDLLTVWDKVVAAAEGKDPDYSYAVLNRQRINFTLLLRLLTEVPAKERKHSFHEKEMQLRLDLKLCEKDLLQSPIVRSRKILIFLLCHCYFIMDLGGRVFMTIRKLSGNKIADAQRRSLS